MVGSINTIERYVFIFRHSFAISWKVESISSHNQNMYVKYSVKMLLRKLELFSRRRYIYITFIRKPLYVCIYIGLPMCANFKPIRFQTHTRSKWIIHYDGEVEDLFNILDYNCYHMHSTHINKYYIYFTILTLSPISLWLSYIIWETSSE